MIQNLMFTFSKYFKNFGIIFFFFLAIIPIIAAPSDLPEILYIPIGDSYTIGTGVTPNHAWPNLLVDHLNSKGIPIKLLANPAHAGWTTKEALEKELPIFESLNPTFATLLIGANDYYQGVDAQTFRTRLVQILDRMTAKLPQKNHLVVVTIPDFSITPTGRQFHPERKVSAQINQFNNIIKEEARSRGLAVADLFEISQGMEKDPSLVCPDGMHPSFKEHVLWEEVIFSKVWAVLKNRPPLNSATASPHQ